jgi:hypothetical protein
MAEQPNRNITLHALAIPATVVISIVGGALLIQARLLGVEHELKQEMAQTRGEMRALSDAINSRTELAHERLRLFASTLKSLNPSLNVPEMK